MSETCETRADKGRAAWFGRVGTLPILLLASGLVVHPVASSLAADCRLEPGLSRSVVKIIDSETVLLDDGRELRLIGALGPRAGDVGAVAGGWPPEEAAKARLGELVLTKSVTLGFGGEHSDRHDRLLAHVFVGEEAEQAWVQGRMLAEGHARSYTQSGNRACAAELLAHERVARDGEIGLWANAAYQTRKPWPARELSAVASSFQIIEGRISRTASGREFVYLNFGRNTRADFSVTIRQSDRALLGDLGGDLKTLEGHTVEVRGWIEHRAGPTIDLSMAGQIVVLGSELTDASETGTAVRPGTPRRRGADKQKRPVLEGTGR